MRGCRCPWTGRRKGGVSGGPGGAGTQQMGACTPGFSSQTLSAGACRDGSSQTCPSAALGAPPPLHLPLVPQGQMLGHLDLGFPPVWGSLPRVGATARTCVPAGGTRVADHTNDTGARRVCCGPVRVSPRSALTQLSPEELLWSPLPRRGHTERGCMGLSCPARTQGSTPRQPAPEL